MRTQLGLTLGRQTDDIDTVHFNCDAAADCYGHLIPTLIDQNL